MFTRIKTSLDCLHTSEWIKTEAVLVLCYYRRTNTQAMLEFFRAYFSKAQSCHSLMYRNGPLHSHLKKDIQYRVS